jgi:hypothetical protein
MTIKTVPVPVSVPVSPRPKSKYVQYDEKATWRIVRPQLLADTEARVRRPLLKQVPRLEQELLAEFATPVEEPPRPWDFPSDASPLRALQQLPADVQDLHLDLHPLRNRVGSHTAKFPANLAVAAEYIDI